ncbi:MAG TPA: ABC transporter substrate-binding protein [Bacillota bacterium]|nr:ABC transporter substrate-binding protein [Bacillota bacterium]
MKILQRVVIGILMISSVLVGCSQSDSKKDDLVEQLGEQVPSITILSATSEENHTTYEVMQMLTNAWDELGIDVYIEPMDVHARIDRLWMPDSRDYDAFTIGYSGRAERLDPDMFIYAIFHSSLAEPGNSNTTGLMHDEFDKYASEQRQEMDLDKRRELVFKAQEILAEEIPVISLYSSTLAHAYNNERFNELVTMAGEGVFNEWMPRQAEPLTDDKWLRIGSINDLDTLNPVGANSVYDWWHLRQIYDKLVRLNTQIEPVPAAASSWEVVDDVTVDITLREGMQFHDGESVTVDDVKFSFDLMQTWHDGYLQAFLEPIESVEILNEETVRFHLVEPYAPFITATLTQIPIIPKHIWEKYADNPQDEPNLEPIGSGPFKFDHWHRGEELKVSKNEQFYEDIQIDGYIYRVYGQPEAVLVALEQEEIDTNADRFIPAHIEQAQSFDFLSIIEVEDIGFEYLGLNLREVPLNDKAFRQALAYAIDYELILDVYLEGRGTVGGPGLVIQPANEFWHNEAAHQPIYDPEKSREILRDAGYQWDEDGRLRMPVEK